MGIAVPAPMPLYGRSAGRCGEIGGRLPLAGRGHVRAIPRENARMPERIEPPSLSRRIEVTPDFYRPPGSCLPKPASLPAPAGAAACRRREHEKSGFEPDFADVRTREGMAITKARGRRKRQTTWVTMDFLQS